MRKCREIAKFKSKFLGSKILQGSAPKHFNRFRDAFNTVHRVQQFSRGFFHSPLRYKQLCTEFLANIRFLSPKVLRGCVPQVTGALVVYRHTLATIRFCWDKAPSTPRYGRLKSVIQSG